MTRSHSSDRLISAGSGWLRAYGMRGMNRCDMLVVCTDVARCGSGMSGMWPRGSSNLLLLLVTRHMCSVGVRFVYGRWMHNVQRGD